MLSAAKSKLASAMRRPYDYANLKESGSYNEQIKWWWKPISILSSWLIIGGFLMLPSSFDTDDGYKVSKVALKALGITTVTVGCLITVVVTFAVRSTYFRLDSIYYPAFTSCLIGLVTTFYSFIVQDRYIWNTSAKLTVVFALLGSIAYGALIILLSRQIRTAKKQPRSQPALLAPTIQEDAPSTFEPSLRSRISVPSFVADPMPQDTDPRERSYYNNYLSNMYPMLRSNSNANRSSVHGSTAMSHDVGSRMPPVPSIRNMAPDAPPATEEELTRQQLQQLLARSAPQAEANGSGANNTRIENGYRIEWQGSEDPTTPMTPRRSAGQQHLQAPSSPDSNPVPPYNDPTSRAPILMGALTAGDWAPVSASPTMSNRDDKRVDAVERAPSAQGDREEKRRDDALSIPGIPAQAHDSSSDRSGRWSAEGIRQDELHPAFRESRFLSTGSDERELRRQQIERSS